MTHTTTTNAVARQIGNMAFLDLFNSRSVFAVKGFDTIRKAKNYAKKCGYQLHDQLPEGVAEYQNPD